MDSAEKDPVLTEEMQEPESTGWSKSVPVVSDADSDFSFAGVSDEDSEDELDALLRKLHRKERVEQFCWQFGTAAVILLSLFFLFYRIVSSPGSPDPAPEAIQTAPSQPTPPPEFPTVPSEQEFSDLPVQENCFTMHDGTLVFLRQKFHDMPILRIPDTIGGQPVTEIPDHLFENLSGVTTIWLPEGITSIGSRAFAGCPDLRGVCLPQSVTTVGTQAFDGCTSLEAVFVPLGTSSIGARAFDNCPSLRYVFYSGFFSDWCDLYDRFITPFTYVLCLDGDFPHAAEVLPEPLPPQ